MGEQNSDDWVAVRMEDGTVIGSAKVENNSGEIEAIIELQRDFLQFLRDNAVRDISIYSKEEQE